MKSLEIVHAVIFLYIGINFYVTGAIISKDKKKYHLSKSFIRDNYLIKSLWIN